MSSADEIQEERRRHEDFQMGQIGVEAGFRESDQETLKGQYLEQLVDSELDTDRKRILANLLSRDFVLGNLNENQIWEMKWQLWIIREKFLAMFPSPEGISGAQRAFLHDDPEAALEPLSQQEIHKVDQFFQGVWTRVTRSEDMKQQELNATSISESYVQRGDVQEDDGGIFSRFRS